jgi:hypothetical protein
MAFDPCHYKTCSGINITVRNNNKILYKRYYAHIFKILSKLNYLQLTVPQSMCQETFNSCLIILNSDSSPESLFLFIVFSKKGLGYLFVSDCHPVYSVQKESRSYYNLYGTIDYEHFCKEEKEDADTQVKNYHEDAKHSMELSEHSVIVHQI